MRKYLLILFSLVMVILLISNATAVPQAKSRSVDKIIEISKENEKIVRSKIKEINEIEEKIKISDGKATKINRLFQESSLQSSVGETGPFIDWLIQLLNKIITALNNLIELIQDLLQIGTLVAMIISLIQNIIDLINELIETISEISIPVTIETSNI